jgi:hypothetical protein
VPGSARAPAADRDQLHLARQRASHLGADPVAGLVKPVPAGPVGDGQPARAEHHPHHGAAFQRLLARDLEVDARVDGLEKPRFRAIF